MSIGIVIATTDFVLMVADGRRSDAYSVLTDKAEKIVPIRDSLSVIEFGAVMSSSAVVEQLKDARTLSEAGSNVVGIIRESIHSAGISLINAVIPDSCDMSRIKVGLLAGGIDEESTYIGGALFGHGMDIPSTQFIRPSPGLPKFICLGGEAVGASNYFANLASRALRISGQDSAALLAMLQRAAKKTVKYAASLDRTIGGHVKYRILAKGLSPRTGLL